MRKLVLSVLLSLLAWPAFAQLPPASGLVIGMPVQGGTNGECLYVSSGRLADQACTTPASPTFSGTVTMPDGATWSSTGIADTASYSTASTPMANVAPTWNFSSTGNGYNAINLTPTLVPTGASAGNGQGTSIGGNIGTAAVNMGTVRGVSGKLTIAAGYSGTITSAVGVLGFITNSGTNAIATAASIQADMTANGNGITGGTVNNYGFTNSTSSTAAAAGGTLNNYGVGINVPGGSGAGTTSNYGLFITGNGGSGGGGTTTNYAIYSGSTAHSLLTGALQIGTTTALTLTQGAFGMAKIAASASAPGAAGGKLELVCGTNAGTAKLVVYAGTSGTAVTVTDNIGTGVTGC